MLKVSAQVASLTTPLLESEAGSAPTGAGDSFTGAARTGSISICNPLLAPQVAHAMQTTAKQQAQGVENLSSRGRLMWLAHTMAELQQTPAHLADLARKAGIQFVCLDHPDRLDDLLTTLRPGPDGWRVADGPLKRLLSEGGWLYVHYEHFSAAEAESLNELFAHQPTFRGQPLHPHVVIFGAMLRSTLAHESASEAFVSRFDAWVDSQDLPKSDTDPTNKLERITPQALASHDAGTIHLFGDHDYTARLCARPSLEDGRAKISAGALRTMLASHDRVVLRDAPWDNVSFCMFVRDLLQGRASDLEGPLRLRQNQSIVRCDGATEQEQDAAKERFLRTPAGELDAHAITARNFGFLSHTIAIQAGQVRRAPGVDEQLPADTPLRVVAKLLPHQWRELAYGASKRRVYVDDRVTLPVWLNDHFVARSVSSAAPQRCDIEDIVKLPQGQSCVVHCDDLDFASHLLLGAIEGAQSFDVGTTHESGDFLYALRRHAHQFAWQAKDMWTALQNGQTVILRRPSCNANVACDLLPLLATQTPRLWCERTSAVMRGRLIVLETAQTYVPAARRLRLEMPATSVVQAMQAQHPWADARWIQTLSDALRDLGALTHRRKRVAGDTPSTWALLRRAAAWQQGEQLLPLYDAQSQGQALAMAFGGTLAFDAEGQTALTHWMVERFGQAHHDLAMLDQPRTHAMWEKKLDTCAELLRRWPAIMLQGPSGAGKTYCTKAVAKRLDATLHGPLSVGDDTSIDEILGEVRIAHGSTGWHPGPIDAWARATGPKPQLLVIDEANLAPADFWNFLSGMFDAKPSVVIDGHRVPIGPHHRLVLTGNQDDYAGRTIGHFIKSHCVTVPFHTFDDGFLVDEILAPTLRRLMPSLPDSEVRAAQDSCRKMLTLLREAHDDQLFTPRNIEEAALRVALHLSHDAQACLPTILAQTLLEIQPGLVSPAQKAALKARTALLWGDVPPLAPQTWVEAAAASHRRLILTESSADLAHAVAEFLAVRAHRRTGEYLGIGQTAMLIEGPSGRGKDEWVMSLAEAAGLRRLPTDTPTPGDGYMSLNAGLGFTHLKTMIDAAQRHGQLVLISELNLLGSALVEGKLNALLQGSAAPGFAVVATVNPGFTGRRTMSDAQRNRCICVSLAPYRQTELLQIAQGRLGQDQDAQAEQVVAYHQGVIATLEAAELAIRPTPRELLRVCDALPDPDTDSVLRRVYRPYLLMANVATVDKGLRCAEPTTHLAALVDWIGSFLGQAGASTVHADDSIDNFGALLPAHRLIRVGAKSTLAQQAAQATVHAVAMAAHPADAELRQHATGPAWQALSLALGYRLTKQLLPQDVDSQAAMFKDLPALPDGASAWERACAAQSRQEHFAFGLACELIAPGTHAAMPLASLNATQRASCQEVVRTAAALVASIDAATEQTRPNPQATMDAVRLGMSDVLRRYHELAPLTAWQAIKSVMPTEAMAAAWDASKAGTMATLAAAGRGARATGRFVVRHKKPILIATAPLWLAPAAVMAVTAGAALGAGAVLVAGMEGVGMGLLWGAEAVGGTLLNWRFNRNLPHPTKPFRYHGSLDKMRDVNFVARPPLYKTTATGTGYLAEGYSSVFTRHGHIGPGRYPDAPAPAPDPLRPAVMQVSVDLDKSADLKKHKGAYCVSLPSVGELCPANVQLLHRGSQDVLPGDIRVERSEDGRFVGILSHSRYQVAGPRSMLARLTPNPKAGAARVSSMGTDVTIKYDLCHQDSTLAAPQTYGRDPLPFRIDYAAWPEFAAFCDTLSATSPKHSVTALCQWLNDQPLYDRGLALALRYGWQDTGLLFKHNPVNQFIRLRRGTALQAAQVLMAVVRDRLQAPVRVATGIYLGDARTPRNQVQTMHAWCEVHLPGQGWVTFDPTPRRWSDDWVTRRGYFYDALAEKLGYYTPPPHVPVLERLGDTFEQTQPTRDTPATERLRISYEVAGDDLLADKFSELLGRDFSESLFVSGLRPQQRLAFAPPGTLDMARMARGEARAFVNTDVGRTPLRKTIIVAACDILLHKTPEGLKDTRAARIFWDAFFRLGCPVEVLRANGDTVAVADVDEILALADHPDHRGSSRQCDNVLRRHDAMVGQADKRARSSNKYARLHREALETSFAASIPDDVQQPAQAPQVKAVIKKLGVKKRANWAALTHVTFHNIALTHRIYDALKFMPQVQSITVSGGLTMGAIRIPYLPELRRVENYSMLRSWFNFDFVPGTTPWALSIQGRVHDLACDTPDMLPMNTRRRHPATLGSIATDAHTPAPQQIQYAAARSADG